MHLNLDAFRWALSIYSNRIEVCTMSQKYPKYMFFFINQDLRIRSKWSQPDVHNIGADSLMVPMALQAP